jgi:hypothetical protein
MESNMLTPPQPLHPSDHVYRAKSIISANPWKPANPTPVPQKVMRNVLVSDLKEDISDEPEAREINKRNNSAIPLLQSEEYAR